MVIKIYISGISGNKEVKKRQQRVLLILDSKNVKYEVIDIAEPGAEEAKDFMQTKSTSPGATISDPSPRHPLPPQIFNDDDYCGDYDLFDMANEIDEMEKFLKLEIADTTENISNAEIKLKNGEVTPDEETAKEEEPATEESEVKENEVPNEQEKPESGEKSIDDESKGEEDLEGVELQKDSKTNDETIEKEESKDEDEDKDEQTKENSESKAKEDTKNEDVSGAGDESGEKEEDEGSSSKTDEEKAENE